MLNITTIIFDLDGVLVETKDLHYKALNKALQRCETNVQIDYDEHVKVFDGLPTGEKLRILNDDNRLDFKLNKKIKELKQLYTIKLLESEIKFNAKLYATLEKFNKNYKIAVATNAVKSTLEICIKKLKIKKFLSFYISNEEVINPKPHPEIYMRAMLETNSSPKETLIVEDSYVGRNAAQDSGAILFPVKKIKDVNYKNIYKFISLHDNLKSKMRKNSWNDDGLNVLIPMAGEGSRFRDAGFTFPKPLIDVNSKPMIQMVIENLNINANFIFIIRKEHQEQYNIKSVLKVLKPGCKIVEVDELTEGAACTVLLAREHIDNSKPLLLANSDQYIEWNSSKTMYNFISKDIDAGILTFDAVHPKWSYAKVDENNIVTEVAEKKVISNHATVGIYYWKKGSDFVKYADQMIKKNIRVNNEFYVCPVFNEAIIDKKIIKIETVKKMWGLGTPEDLNYFVQNNK